MAEQGFEGVPDAYRQAAEEIREHLVSLRGGAPFLSPADALQLVDWFDRGVPVGDILRALERAHAARRRSPSRIPFGLRQARRHLGRPTTGSLRVPPVEARPEDGPLGRLAAAIRARAGGDPRRAELVALADELAAIRTDEADGLVREALARIRAFRDDVWEKAALGAREAARQAARDELAELLADLDEATALALVEEEARERIRSPYAWLDAASVWDALEGL